MSDDRQDVRLEIEIDAAPETVFALLTDRAQMRSWLAELVEAEPRPGGTFRISEPSTGAIIEGIYLEVTPNRKVVFTWGGVEGVRAGESTVEFLLEPRGRGTLLRLRHYGLPGPAIESHRYGWVHSGLGKLKGAAEGRPPARLCLNELTGLRAAER
jgi:uncharacterized protein YndB with AHSA1/START domain